MVSPQHWDFGFFLIGPPETNLDHPNYLKQEFVSLFLVLQSAICHFVLLPATTSGRINMGANCCVAVKHKPLPDSARFDASLYRNTRHSPPWSFRRNNRTHILDKLDKLDNMDNAKNQFYHNRDVAAVSEIKSGRADTEGISDDWSLSNQTGNSTMALSRPESEKTEQCNEDQFARHYFRHEGKDRAELTCFASSSEIKTLVSVPSLEEFKGESSKSCSEVIEQTSSKMEYFSLGQVSESKTSSLKALNENSSPEGRRSTELSTSSKALAKGSRGGLPDGWSLRTFTKLVKSGQRERRPFKSGNLSSNKSESSPGANALQSMPLSPGHKMCSICSKLLKEKCVADAVLACGHVYHADCLENATPLTYIYDPPCPICIHGEKTAARLLSKVESKGENKISRNSNADEDAFWAKRASKGPRFAASSSMKSSYRGPIMRRHFSLGLRSKSASASETSWKRGLW